MDKQNKKDPAFLFYSNDWLQGTSQMFPIEKGVYIDLLAHQHQNGFLPNNTLRLSKMVGLSESEFLPVWAVIKEKFLESEGRLYNRKLADVVLNRHEFGETRMIIGTFGKLINALELSEAQKKEIKKQFNYKDFVLEFQQNKQNYQQNVSKAISKWLSKWLSKAKANEGHNKNLLIATHVNENINENENTYNKNNTVVKDSSNYTEAGNKKFNCYPKYDENKELEFPKAKTIKCIEFLSSKNIKQTEGQLLSRWEVFKIQNLTGKKYYDDEEAVHSHFINVLHKIPSEPLISENGQSNNSKHSRTSKGLSFDKP